MALDFDEVYPYSEIKTVDVDGQKMVWIPKFYVKTGNAPDSSNYAGDKTYMISEFAQDGYRLHPAFMYKGEERDGFYIGAYEASTDASASTKAASVAGKSPLVSINFSTMQTRCTARNTGTTGDTAGWHLENVYEAGAVNLLMLIELGSPDVQTKIGNGNVSNSTAVSTGSSNAVWRGIHEWWGNVWEMVDGLKGDGSGKALIFDRKGNETYVATGVTPANGSEWTYPIDTYTTVTDDYDLASIFMPSSVGTSSTSGTFGDGIYGSVASSFVLYRGARWADGSSAGAFAWRVIIGVSDSRTYFGGRLAKYAI